MRMSLDHVEKAQVLARLDRIHRLINELERMVATTADRQRIRDRMRREVDAAKDAIRVLGAHDPMRPPIGSRLNPATTRFACPAEPLTTATTAEAESAIPDAAQTKELAHLPRGIAPA